MMRASTAHFGYNVQSDIVVASLERLKDNTLIISKDEV